jgi:hypothetical protein
MERRSEPEGEMEIIQVNYGDLHQPRLKDGLQYDPQEQGIGPGWLVKRAGSIRE